MCLTFFIGTCAFLLVIGCVSSDQGDNDIEAGRENSEIVLTPVNTAMAEAIYIYNLLSQNKNSSIQNYVRKEVRYSLGVWTQVLQI